MTKDSRRKPRIADRALCVLIDARPSAAEFAQLVATLTDAGVPVMQLREKNLPDRALLQRARQMRELTRDSDTLFIMNDRPDLAVLAEADGVHVGQDELTVADCRAILGPQRLVGVSTHSLEQAKAAVADRADYIGVGPVFPSMTKSFHEFPGLELLRQVSAEIRLPAFAIGGITRENVGDVRKAGCTRAAVSSAVMEAADPRAAAVALMAEL